MSKYITVIAEEVQEGSQTVETKDLVPNSSSDNTYLTLANALTLSDHLLPHLVDGDNSIMKILF